MLERIKTAFITIIKSRLFVVALVFCVLFAILIQRVFSLQIVNGQSYLDDYKLRIKKTKEVQGTRGRILDKNGNVLAENVLAYSVTIEDNGEYDERSEKNEVLNNTLQRVIEIVERNGDTVIGSFGIIINDSGEYEFVSEGTTRQRFLADVFGLATIDKLGDKADYSADEVMDYLCTDKDYGYDLDQEALTKEEVLKIVNIRYAIWLKSYQKYLETTIAKDVSEETVAETMENMDMLQGVSIAEDSVRKYYNSKYFASIIGYTGQISQDEYDALDEETQKSYSLTDVVGKSGLEKVLDQELQGDKGSMTLYVDNVGNIIETEKEQDPAAGNDVYLTIDADLHMAAYDILEEKLAGLLLSKMVNSLTFDRTAVGTSNDVRVPIGDVYNAFFDNEIINTSSFEKSDAGETEAAVYNTYLDVLDSTLSAIVGTAAAADGSAYNDLSSEMQAYLDFITGTYLTDTGIIMQESLDTADETYLAWKDGTISFYEYLNYAISQNWIDSSILQDDESDDSKYSDMQEVYQGVLNYLNEKLRTSNDFKKLIYKYMIRNQNITGTQVCLILYEQEVLSYDETQYQNLKSGATASYDFIRGKIETLDITPGQLGLEPCSGSFVMTDVNTGQVLACVSYPGYDSNLLANSSDSTYYAQLLSSSSSPLYNKATQEKTAPGSTYKAMTAVAGLTEGVVTTDTAINCTGTFDKISQGPKCWIYPSAHGWLSVESAIQHSCNDYFYEVGWRLGLSDNAISDTTVDSQENTGFSNDRGLELLRKYATQFGLNETSGVEIQESEGQISNEDSVRSAIGQGSNNYTTTQLARYITTVANKGTLYSLTLLQKTTDVDGNLLEEYQPEVTGTLDNVSDSTWNAVHNGMRRVVSSSSTYNSVTNTGFSFSGKTGTAQQSTTHPDHALFVGFAPSDTPEVAFSCRIANGYSSQFAAEVGRDVVRYKYKLAEKDEIITGQAADVSGNVVSGD
ncbi:MAG: penicillin-binding transpeptidase domain-containing protein [Lachnospiraceae bacterium]